MKNENLIHVKLEYEEALQSKKEILSSEMNLIKIMKVMKHYRFLRLKELKTKLKLRQKIKEMVADIKKIKTTLPKLKIPEILQKDKTTKKLEKLEIKKEPYYDKSLESQLKDIQRKLNALQQ